jgi:hypothetical protein
MSIKYSYKITNPYIIEHANLQEKFIDILYSSSGRGDMCRSVRLPSSSEQIENIIRESAPIFDWEEELNVAIRAAANPLPVYTAANIMAVTII